MAMKLYSDTSVSNIATAIRGRQGLTGKNLFDNTLAPNYSNGTSVSTIEYGKRAIYLDGTNSFSVFAIKDLRGYVGKTVKMKCDFVESGNNKGAYNIGLCSNTGTNRIVKVGRDTSGVEISFVVPELEVGREYLGLWLYSTNGGTTQVGDYVDYTNIIVTIDDEVEPYEPYCKYKIGEMDEGINKLPSIPAVSNLNVVNTTQESTALTITDGKEAQINKIDVLGRTEQKTTTGKNIFSTTSYLAYETYVENVQNNSFRVIARGSTPNRGVVVYPKDKYGEYIRIENILNKTVRIKADINKSSSLLNPVYTISEGGGALGTTEMITGNSIVSFVFTNVTSSYPYLCFYFFVTNTGGTVVQNNYVDFSNIIVTIDNSDMTYEPYTGGIPSPNPDYPSPIENIRGRNLFDSEDWYNKLSEISSQSMSKETVGGIEYYKVYPSFINNYQYMKGKFKKNTQYTLSCKARQYDQDTQAGTGFGIIYTDGTNTDLYVTKTMTEYNFCLTSLPNKTIDYIRIPYYQYYGILVRDIQLEEGTEATPYTPYNTINFSVTNGNNVQTVAFPLGDKVLMQGSKLTDYGFYDERGQYTFTGNETVDNYAGGTYSFIIRSPNLNIRHDTTSYNVLCNRLFGTILDELYRLRNISGENIISSFTSGVVVMMKNFTTTSEIKSYITEEYEDNKPIKIEYLLVTPTITPYTPEQQTAYNQLKALLLHTGTNYITTDGNLPPNMKIEYKQDGLLVVKNSLN